MLVMISIDITVVMATSADSAIIWVKGNNYLNLIYVKKISKIMKRTVRK